MTKQDLQAIFVVRELDLNVDNLRTFIALRNAAAGGYELKRNPAHLRSEPDSSIET